MYIKQKHPISTTEKEMVVIKLHEFGKENEIYSRSIKDIISRISDGEEMWDVEKEGEGEKIEEAESKREGDARESPGSNGGDAEEV